MLVIKRYYTIIICVLNISLGLSQNLVPNYSFESNIGCPWNVNQVDFARPWFNPTGGSSDYIHTCATWPAVAAPLNYWGTQNPRTGEAYMGLFVCMHYPADPSIEEQREYIEVKLTSTLVSGQKYYASFYVSLGDKENYATDDFGIHFSNDTVKSTAQTNLTVTPQIQNPSGNYLISKYSWTRISGVYTANGTENFITIGNFKDAANTDTIKVLGGSNPNLIDYSPGYYYIDDVCVSTDSNECLALVGIQEIPDQVTYKVFPNPFSDKATIQFNNVIGGSYSVNIYNSKGNLVRSIANITRNSLTIEKGDLIEGLYYFHLYCDKSIVAKGKLTID